MVSFLPGCGSPEGGRGHRASAQPSGARLGVPSRLAPAANSKRSSTNSASRRSTDRAPAGRRRPGVPDADGSRRAAARPAASAPPLTARFEFTERPKIDWLILGGEQPELRFNIRAATRNGGHGRQQVARCRTHGPLRTRPAVDRGTISGSTVRPPSSRAFPTRLGLTRSAKYALQLGGARPAALAPAIA